jgi:putative ABC transport system permease protein
MATAVQIRKSMTIALRALRRNRLQTLLTVVGMTIGVATVLAMIALGSGAQAAIQDQVRAAGMNVIVVTAGNYKMPQQWTSQGEAEEPTAYRPDGPREQRPRLVRIGGQPGTNPQQEMARRGENAAGLGAALTLTLEDAEAIAGLGNVQSVSGGVAENGAVLYGAASRYTRLHGESEGLPAIRRAWVFPHGRFYTRGEVQGAENVAVLGSVLSEKLFGPANPVGEHVTVRDTNFTVVGVVASGSWMVPAAEGDDQFDAVYIPVTTALRLLGRGSLSSLTVATSSTGEVNRVTKAIAALLRQRHGLRADQPDDFVVASQARRSLARGGMRTDVTRAIMGNASNLDKVTLDQLGKTLDRASRTMTVLLASIASVSLLVGGIGIMNIMLLSVTERTREIGIRRAVGARSDEVMLQFLMEAVTLSLGGGLLGIVLGVVASVGITRAAHWSATVSPVAVVASFGVSAAVGICFGYYPARQASRVTPMTSLRYE